MIALTLLTTGTTWAEDFPKDSLKVVDIEEVVVIATPKENRKLRELPAATTVLSQKDMQANQVNSVKRLSGLIPNIFIPEYGSKLTTSIYIRGIGSRDVYKRQTMISIMASSFCTERIRWLIQPPP